MKTEKQISINLHQHNIHELYDKYSGMLFGYIYEIVRDNKIAEQHLINIYNYIPDHINEFDGEVANTWCQLLRLTKKYLEFSKGALYNNQLYGADLNEYDDRNRFLGLLTIEQKQVFCNIYYYGKTTAELSEELNRSEELIRIALKEALIIIKKG